MSCPHCPAAGYCLAWPIFCHLAAAEPPDPVCLAHIRYRSGMPAEVAAAAPPGPEAAEAIALARSMHACPYRSTRGCGCSGAKCGLRGGGFVAHPDCFACMSEFG